MIPTPETLREQAEMWRRSSFGQDAKLSKLLDAAADAWLEERAATAKEYLRLDVALDAMRNNNASLRARLAKAVKAAAKDCPLHAASRCNGGVGCPCGLHGVLAALAPEAAQEMQEDFELIPADGPLEAMVRRAERAEGLLRTVREIADRRKDPSPPTLGRFIVCIIDGEPIMAAPDAGRDRRR